MAKKLIGAGLAALLCAALLSGCGALFPAAAQTAATPEPTEEVVIDQGQPEMDLSDKSLDELRQSLPELTNLQKASVDADTLGTEALRELQALRPDVSFLFHVTLNGKSCDENTEQIDLAGADRKTMEESFAWAALLPNLKTLELGTGDAAASTIPWEALARLRADRPELQVNYDFTLYGQEFSLDSEEMNLTHIPIDDQGALVKAITACMPNLRYLDMDSCGVDDEHMAEIRDALPQADVVWRIWFGVVGHGTAGYSVRTDVERILASNPGIGGELTPENTESLKYCTKVKYLDVGHNSYMRSIEFVRYMPDLEAVVLAMGNWFDASPLENCTKLRYAELQTTCLSDLRPLTKLKNLEDLNLCYCFALHDISPLYELPQLKRLYLGKLTPIPTEQVAKMQEIAPDCEIDVTTVNPTDGHWRYTGHDDYGVNYVAPAYQWLRDVMRYDEAPYSYAYPYNDPLY